MKFHEWQNLQTKKLYVVKREQEPGYQFYHYTRRGEVEVICAECLTYAHDLEQSVCEDCDLVVHYGINHQCAQGFSLSNPDPRFGFYCLGCIHGEL